MTTRFSRAYAATLAKTQEEKRAALRQPPEWTTGGNCEFIDITGMGVSRVPVPSSDGGCAARDSAENVAGRLPDKGSAAANEAALGAPVGIQSGSLERMLSFSRKQLAMRQHKPIAKHANETLSRAVASTPAVVSSLSNGTSNGPTPSKFRNVPTNGYHSKREAKRALDLSLMLVAGQVRNLRAQVKYLLIPKQDGERECSYVADFVYEERGFVTDFGTIWNSIVEDCKGFRTPDYIIKRKLMLFVHQIKIRET